MIDGQKKTTIQLRAKIAVMGESGVGKSGLVRRFVFGTFEGEETQSYGTKVSRIELVMPRDSETEVRLTLSIYDAMGHAELKDIHKETFFFGCDGLVAVCDATRKDTLYLLQNWMAAATAVCGEVPKVIVVNKKDVLDKARIREAEVERIAQIHECPYAFVSAKTGELVDEAFDALAIEIVERELREAESHRLEEGLKAQLLGVIVRKGRLGTNKEDLFTTFKGASYDEIEQELDRLEREGMIEIFWRGPADFTIFPTQLGERYVRLGHQADAR